MNNETTELCKNLVDGIMSQVENKFKTEAKKRYIVYLSLSSMCKIFALEDEKLLNSEEISEIKKSIEDITNKTIMVDLE